MKVFIKIHINSRWRAQIERAREACPALQFTADEQDIPESEVFMGVGFSSEAFQRAEKLRAVIVPMTGVDSLPLEELSQRSVLVGNVHGNARSVAERTIALVLAWYGNIIPYHRDLQRGIWHGFWVNNGLKDTWESLNGKTCVILGAGSIGRYIAEMLKPFGVTVTGYRRRDKPLSPPFDRTVFDIDEALKAGEIVISVLPDTPETQGILNKQRLSQMHHQVLVNVGRSGVAVEQDLFEALQMRTLRGAALDCWYQYPSGNNGRAPSQYPFGELDNVIMSPHLGGYTRDAAVQSNADAFDNLIHFCTTGKLLYGVDLRRGY